MAGQVSDFEVLVLMILLKFISETPVDFSIKTATNTQTPKPTK